MAIATESKSTVAASESETQDDPVGQVDKGVVAWTVVLGAWCCLFCAFGWVNGVSTESTFSCIN